MPEEMAGLIAHFNLIGRQFADVMRMKNDADADVYPNRHAPVLVMQDCQPVMRTDMLWGSPPHGGKGPYGTNYRTLNNSTWRPWLDREHRCVVPVTAFAEPTIPPSPWSGAGLPARMACRFSSPESGAPGPVIGEPRRRRILATITSSRS